LDEYAPLPHPDYEGFDPQQAKSPEPAHKSPGLITDLEIKLPAGTVLRQAI